MRVEVPPTPDTLDELSEYISSLVDREHDYGTCVYAMSLAAVAAFNHVAHKLGVTGFQASCADLHILRLTRHYKGPFMVIDGSKMLYPQYDLNEQLREAMEKWRDWAAKEAAVNLKTNKKGAVSPAVWARWVELASYNQPTPDAPAEGETHD